MADTTFTDYSTVVPAAWLNDINDRNYVDSINVCNAPYNVVADDVTDQTTAINAVFTALTSSYEGEIIIPPNVRFSFADVIDNIPNSAVVRFSTAKQSGSGYRQQLIGTMDNPPDANTDTATTIISTHYPDLMLNNTRTGGTSSASNGLSGFSWSRGFFTNGTKGPRVQWQSNYRRSAERTAEHGGLGVACFVSKTRAPERAGNYEQWFNGIVVAIGDYIEATNGAFYRATTAGTSTVSPVHTSGSATIGGITWAFESSFVPFRTNFYYDELGRIGTNDCPSGYTHNWEQNPEDTEDFSVYYTPKGASKKFRMRFGATDASSVAVASPMFDVSESGGFRMLDSGGNRAYFRALDSRNFELGNFGYVTNTVADLDTTPSVLSGARFLFSNSGATSVTTLDDGLENQSVILHVTNGNTTFVHSSGFKLKGAVNTNPAADGIITMIRNVANTGWVELSRNY